MARLEFPRETGLILRCAGKAGNPFQTYVNKIASRNLLYDSGNSNWGSEITWRVGDGRDVGGRFEKEGTFMWII